MLIRKVGYLVGIAAAVLLVLGILAADGSLKGWRVFTIVSGSMGDALPTGSLLITRPVPDPEYKDGDVIAFTMPGNERTIVTHRITEIVTRQGLRMIHTKGDANTNGDPVATRTNAIVGKEAVHIRYIGFLLGLVRTNYGFLAFVLVTFVLIVARELSYIASCLGQST